MPRHFFLRVCLALVISVAILAPIGTVGFVTGCYVGKMINERIPTESKRESRARVQMAEAIILATELREERRRLERQVLR